MRVVRKQGLHEIKQLLVFLNVNFMWEKLGLLHKPTFLFNTMNDPGEKPQHSRVTNRIQCYQKNKK